MSEGKGEGRLRRVTVNLTPAGQRALDSLCDATGEVQSAVINKGLRVFAHLEEAWAAGGRVVVVVDGKGTDLRIL